MKACRLFHRAIPWFKKMTELNQNNVKRLISDLPEPDSKKLCVETEDIVKRVPKRKVALLMGYSGQGYLGMQRNPTTKTVEEDLLVALLKAGYITEEHFNQIQQIHFQRAARTDKGVSACRQVVSLKIPEGSVREEINKFLPDQIRVFSIIRVTKGFNSKSSCDARTYSYSLPTFAFATGDAGYDEGYRINEATIENVKNVLNVFVGVHRFHNYTSRKKYADPSAFRNILKFECGEPFVVDKLEFVTLKVKGQSFMMHQIRKMVATVIAVVRGLTSIDLIEKTWGPCRYDIPRAPGLGLVLEQVHYDKYNEKFGKDGMHQSLSWEDREDEILEFRDKFIFSVIASTEVAEKSMLLWLETLPKHTFDVREEGSPSLNKNHVKDDSDDEEEYEEDDENRKSVRGEENMDGDIEKHKSRTSQS